MVIVKHPIGGLKKSDVGSRMAPQIDNMLAALTLEPAELIRRAGNRTIEGFRPPRPRVAAIETAGGTDG